MQSQIKKVKFKSGLPLEIEVIPIADTVLKHHETITNPHRAEFYHIFWVQKGTAEYLVDFEPVKVAKEIIMHAGGQLYTLTL